MLTNAFGRNRVSGSGLWPTLRRFWTRWSSWQGGPTHRGRLALELAVAAIALWPVAVLAFVFAERLAYPIDLEWMEGGTLYQAYRVLHGLPLYVDEITDFAPYPYPPVHTLLLAVLGCIKLDFWSGRLLSIASFVLICTILLREVSRQHDGSSFGVSAGLLAVATIVCGYPILGQWYDLVRVDVTMMGLLVWGAARALRSRPSWRSAIGTAALLVLAIFTKQTAGAFVAWVCLFAITAEPKRGIRLGALVAAFTIVSYVLLNWWTNGGFEYFVISTPGQHELKPAAAVEGLSILLRFAPFLAVLPVLFLLLAQRRWLSNRTIFWSGCLLLAFPASLVPYAKVGAYLNALLPVVVFAGPTLALLLGEIAKQPGALGSATRWLSLAGLAAFIASRSLSPLEYIPSSEKWRAARELNAIVESLEGGVVVPYLGYLPARNGHTNSHWQLMAVWDSIWRNQPMDEIRALQLSNPHWVLLHSQDTGTFASYVRAHSRLRQQIPPTARVRMVTGAAVEIDEVWELVGNGS